MSSSSDQEDLQKQGESSDEEVQSDVADEADSGDSDAEEETAETHAIDASSTESDEDDDEVDDDEDIPQPKPKAKKVSPKLEASRLEKIQQQVLERYEKRKGRQLFIRFPAKLPTDIDEFNKKIKDVSDLIVMGHKPRQKYARFCLVDFASTEDRDIAIKKLTKDSAENKLVVSLPRCEGDNFVEKLAERQVKKYENTKAKKLIKKESMKTVLCDFSSTIRILNIPNSTSVAQIKELIPEAVDVNLKAAPKKFAGTSIATVTMPSTMDASRTARKTFTLGHNKLILRLNHFKKSERKKVKKVRSALKIAATGDAIKESAVPSATGNKQKQQKNTESEKQDKKEPNSKKNKNKNKKNKANGAGAAPEEKAKSTEMIEVSDKVEVKVPKKKAKVVGDAPEVKEVVLNAKKNKNKKKKNKAANGDEAAPEKKVKSPKKREINDDAEVKLPKKKAKTEDAPEVKAVVQKAKKNKKKNKNTPKENNTTAEMKSDAAPNKKGPSKKPQQPNKQKKKVGKPATK